MVIVELARSWSWIKTRLVENKYWKKKEEKNYDTCCRWGPRSCDIVMCFYARIDGKKQQRGYHICIVNTCSNVNSSTHMWYSHYYFFNKGFVTNSVTFRGLKLFIFSTFDCNIRFRIAIQSIAFLLSRYSPNAHLFDRY